MRITATEEYGLRCLLEVARRVQEGKPTTIRGIAEKEGISMEYATKLMMKLRKGGLVKSVRGANGGYTLVGTVEEVSLAKVMQILDSNDYMDQQEDGSGSKFCDHFTGLKQECVHKGSCSVRPLWVTVSGYLYGALKHITLKQLLDSETG